MVEYSAWDFGDENRLFTSNSNKWHLYYQDFVEIAMGGPLAGKLYLKDHRGKQILIDEFAAGPPVWHSESDKFVVPKWDKDRTQELWMINLNNFEKTVFNEKFRVLELHEFVEDKIIGIDGPIHYPRKLNLSSRDDGIKMPLEKKRVKGSRGKNVLIWFIVIIVSILLIFW